MATRYSAFAQGLILAFVLACLTTAQAQDSEGIRLGPLLNSTAQLDPLVDMNIAYIPPSNATYDCNDTTGSNPAVKKTHGNWTSQCDPPGINMTALNITAMFGASIPTIPYSISNLFALTQLNMSSANLSNIIPVSLGYMGFMQNLDISNNSFNGSVPATLFILTDLTSLRISSNQLSGPVSTAVGNVLTLQHLDVSNNFLSGTILANLNTLSALTYLDISNNNQTRLVNQPYIQQMTNSTNFTLSSPGFNDSLESTTNWGNLTSLQHLDLSFNPITGNITQLPWEAWANNSGVPALTYLNIKGTKIKGEFPKQAYQSMNLSMVVVSSESLSELCYFNISDPGNSRFDNWNKTYICTQLCVGACSAIPTSNIGLVIGVVIGVAGFVMIILVGAYYFLRARRFNDGVEVHGVRRFTLPELEEATSGYEIILGKGGFGEVYKGVVNMEDGKTKEVAVKKTKAERRKNMKKFDSGFRNEVLVLSGVRHRNLVELIGYSSKGADVLLVYEFISQGSVDDLLRKELNDEGVGEASLTWERRLKVAFGAAQGLDYLHSGVTPPIIHRDIKSSNILVDMEFVAKVADFGLSKIRPEMDLDGQKTMGVQGTLGYIDPEYAATLKPTERSDVYSFGVVLLELATGWRPIGGPEKKHIIQRVARGVNNAGFDSILAPSIRKELEDAEDGRTGTAERAVIYTGDSSGDGQGGAEVTIAAYSPELFQRFVKLGMQCCAKDSSTRPSMRTVAKALGEMIEGKAEDPADAIQEDRFDEDGGEEVVLLTHNLGGEVGATVAFVMETQVGPR